MEGWLGGTTFFAVTPEQEQDTLRQRDQQVPCL